MARDLSLFALGTLWLVCLLCPSIFRANPPSRFRLGARLARMRPSHEDCRSEPTFSLRWVAPLGREEGSSGSPVRSSRNELGCEEAAGLCVGHENA